MTGYNGAEYCSFKLKREADKYLKTKKTKKKKDQEKADAQNNTQSDQRHDNDETTNSVNANKIPEETNGTQQQGDERDFIVMEEYSYNQELKEKLIKNEDDLQNLWNGFDLLWSLWKIRKDVWKV